MSTLKQRSVLLGGRTWSFHVQAGGSSYCHSLEPALKALSKPVLHHTWKLQADDEELPAELCAVAAFVPPAPPPLRGAPDSSSDSGVADSSAAEAGPTACDSAGAGSHGRWGRPPQRAAGFLQARAALPRWPHRTGPA